MHALEDGLFEQALANHHRLLAMKYAMLPALLNEREPDSTEVIDKLDGLLSAVAGVTASRLVAAATPFFWLNVERCVAATATDGENVEPLGHYLLTTAFDALFELLPDGAAVELGRDYDCDVQLPKLGLQVAASALPVTLRRASADVLEVETGGSAHRLRLPASDLAAPFADPVRPISDGSPARILLAPNHSVVDDVSALESVPATVDVGPLATMMAQALEFIGAADRVLAQQIDAAVGWYVPVKTSDLRVHRSFTVERQAGVIFLSEALDPVLLAEAIVHEFYHTVLHIVTETEDVFGGLDPDERFYSPWRDDPRPLSGLFHALYVFSGVDGFYAGVGTGVDDPARAQIIGQRRAKLHRQLRLGLAQLPRERLPEAARRIVGAIESQLDTDPPRLEDDAVARTVAGHLETWCKDNPDLANRVRRPS